VYVPSVPVFFGSLPDGDAGVRATLELMRDMVRRAKKAPAVRLTALDLVSDLPQKDYTGQVVALHRYVRDSIRYVRDIRNVETLQTPEFTLEWGQGDCDDKSILLASLLESIGHRTRFCAVGYGFSGFQHVFPQTLVGNRWVTLETTEPVDVGWNPRRPARVMTMHN
jgi:transglutaminase-like putative cysteine protease